MWYYNIATQKQFCLLRGVHTATQQEYLILWFKLSLAEKNRTLLFRRMLTAIKKLLIGKEKQSILESEIIIAKLFKARLLLKHLFKYNLLYQPRIQLLFFYIFVAKRLIFKFKIFFKKHLTLFKM